MKIIITLMVTLFSLSSFAAFIKGAKVDSRGRYLILTVAYGGGCKEHSFSIDELICHTSYPAKCETRLIETVKNGPDECYDMIKEDILLKLKDLNINATDLSNGTLKIIGGTPQGETEPTQVKVKFPEF